MLLATWCEFELFKVLVCRLLPAAGMKAALASMLESSFGIDNLRRLYLALPSIRESAGASDKLTDHATRLLLRGLRT